jgi:hypothetical protein
MTYMHGTGTTNKYERWWKYMASSHTIVLWRQLEHETENSYLKPLWRRTDIQDCNYNYQQL